MKDNKKTQNGKTGNKEKSSTMRVNTNICNTISNEVEKF